MTDYTKLIERLESDIALTPVSAIAREAADAIEALQTECAEHKENAIRNARQAVAFRADRDALQAKLDELRRQEPVEYQSFTKPGFISCSPASWEPCTHEQYQDHFIEGTPVRKLYASPKALAPLTDERIDELAVTALTDYREGRNNDHERAFARAIEAAHGIGGTP